MKHIFLFVLSVGLFFLSGCDGSSDEPIVIHYGEEDSQEENCSEKLDIDESSWSTTLSDNSYIKEQICDSTVAFFDDYDIKVSCLSVNYSSRNKRFDVTLDDKGKKRSFRVVISECRFKLATDSVYDYLIEDMGYWNMDKCFCKKEDGKVSYRESESPIVVGSSSSSKKENKSSSSSSEKKQSSSSKNEEFSDSNFIKIDSLYWMKKNLDVEVEGSRCYDDDSTNCEKYGRLYTWSQAMGIDKKYDTEKKGNTIVPHQGICPEGTHLPSDAEWLSLRNYVNTHSEYKKYFMNQLGGVYDYRGMYRSEGDEALFWSSKEYEVTDSYYRDEFAWLWAFHEDGTTATDNAHKITGAYVRCVKNGENDGKEESSSSAEVSSSSVKSSSSKEVKLTDDDFVKINTLFWTKKNLDIEVEGSMCYDNDPANCEKYGRLYTWSQAMAIDKKYDGEKYGKITLPYQGICPEGTHLPSDAEWALVAGFFNGHSEEMSVFTNQLGGAFDYKGMYRSKDYEALFWSSTEYEVTESRYKFEYAWLWGFHSDKTVSSDNAHKITGAYVRCVKNTAP
ncbi:MAG: hypothetical protein J6W54_01240 [Fibrobacter sp.]|nr:hypothetical protein [Fibrobacter sp.]